MKKKTPGNDSEFSELTVETDEAGRTCVRSIFRHDESLKHARLSRKKLWDKGAPFPCPEYRAIENLRQLQSMNNTSDELSEAERFAGRLVSIAAQKGDLASLRRLVASLKDIVDEKSAPSDRSAIEKLRECARMYLLRSKRIATKQELRKQAEIEGIVSTNTDDAEFSRLLRDAHLAKILPTDHKAKGNRRKS